MCGWKEYLLVETHLILNILYVYIYLGDSQKKNKAVYLNFISNFIFHRNRSSSSWQQFSLVLPSYKYVLIFQKKLHSLSFP